MYVQVRVEGTLDRTSAEESDAYFESRPHGHRLGAWSSEQSREIDSAAELERRFQEVEERFKDREVPRPAHWGGYRVTPETMEFWQGRKSRVHDRLLYTRQRDGSWTRSRLAP